MTIQSGREIWLDDAAATTFSKDRCYRQNRWSSFTWHQPAVCEHCWWCVAVSSVNTSRGDTMDNIFTLAGSHD